LCLGQNSWIFTATIEFLDVAAEAVAAKGASRGKISYGMASTVDLVAAYSIETKVLMDDENCERAEVALATEEVKGATARRKVTAETSAPIAALSETKRTVVW
jgi:hypothetical protein